jgi:hypothetical protein
VSFYSSEGKRWWFLQSSMRSGGLWAASKYCFPRVRQGVKSQSLAVGQNCMTPSQAIIGTNIIECDGSTQ